MNFFQQLFWDTVGVPDSLTHRCVVVLMKRQSDGRPMAIPRPVHPETDPDAPIVYISPPFYFGADEVPQ